MKLINKNRLFIFILATLSFLTVFFIFSFFAKYKEANFEKNIKQYKKLSNFNVPVMALEKALKYDILEHSKNQKTEIKFVPIISLLAAKYYGNWDEYKEKDMDEIVKRLKKGEKEQDLASLYKNYTYFKKFYESLLSEFVGYYKISDGIGKEAEKNFKEKYGLKAYSPIAYGYRTSFCDDFDNETSFSKNTGHFGNDIAVKKGVPFVAVESGTIEKCEQKEGTAGELELKSFDGVRTYCYYNCNKEKPFADGIKKGSIVFGGQMLGYVGANNCCKKGGSKMLRCPYLHFAIKIKIKEVNEEDEQEKREIFIDSFNILKFLEHHKSALIRDNNNFSQKYIFEDEPFLKRKNHI